MKRQHPLPTGTLTLTVPDGAPVDEYLFVAARRRNPKRGFLFVSTVLGKHVPVSLERLEATHRALAERVEDGPGDVLVIGMAETATLLGYGVFRTLQARLSETARRAFYLQSTRYPTGAQRWAFEEAHSHAPQQWLEGLDDPRLAGVRRVVLVDDELSTGATFERLEAVVRAALPQIERVSWAVLTDFRAAPVRAAQARTVASLLEGEWTWTPLNGPDEPPADPIDEQAVPPERLVTGFGRAKPVAHSGEAEAFFGGAAQALDRPGGRVLVLGSGEFMPLPYELARALKHAAPEAAVFFQATTRSPAAMPGLALGVDHYGGGVPQFLYHYDRRQWDAVVLVVETPADTAAEQLAATLGARLVSLHPDARPPHNP